MKIGGVKDMSRAHGTGRRLVFYLDREGYNMLTWQIVKYIKNMHPWVDGITITGLPLEQHVELTELLQAIRTDADIRDIDIWMYTTYTLDNIPKRIKNKVDVIVDGEPISYLPPAKWRSSSNQKIYKRIKKNEFEEIYKEEDYNL